MANCAAARKRLERERAALNLLPCTPWIRADAFEILIDNGVMTENEADDPEARARWVKMVFEAFVDELSHCDTQRA